VISDNAALLEDDAGGLTSAGETTITTSQLLDNTPRNCVTGSAGRIINGGGNVESPGTSCFGPTLTTESLPDWTADHPGYDETLTATGGTGPLSYSVSDGALPPGLTLDPDGVISGTPTTPGSFTFTIAVTDTTGATDSRPYTVAVNEPLVLGPPTLPDGTVGGSNYAATIRAEGGTGEKTLALTDGELPPGLTFDPETGRLSGTPTTTGTFSFVITATDALGATAARPFDLQIDEGSGPGPGPSVPAPPVAATPRFTG
jgi:hypothetical protein